MSSNFGNFLKEKRQEKKLTQKGLAEKLFVSESAVSKWEKNIAHPDITLLPKLSEILETTEHELITASVDNKLRSEKIQAKKWRTLSFSWSLFFYISYALALIPCFICNLAIDKTLSWFWIVVSALLLAFSFTNLPKLIKKNKLILIPLSMFLALCLLLLVCCIYTQGNWFWVATLSVLFGLIIIFVPIYISKYKIFSKIKNYNDFVSIFIDFVALNILLIVVNIYTNINNSTGNWYLTLALPIVCISYLILNIFLCVRFLKLNKLLKTSIILFLINILYLFPTFIKVNNPSVQKEIDDMNIFKANFTSWIPEAGLDNNVSLIVFLTILFLAVSFLVFGLIKHIKIKTIGE